MMAVIEKQNMDEDDLADQLEDAVPSAHKWQELATSDDTNGEVGADGGGAVQNHRGDMLPKVHSFCIEGNLQIC